MDEFSKLIQIRWSDLDPNFHLRHSVYYDWGAFCRVEFLNEHGLTAGLMQQLIVRHIKIIAHHLLYGVNGDFFT